MLQKTESCSQPLADTFEKAVNSLKDGNTSLTAIQKLLTNTVAKRDYSSQETSHLLLHLPMCNASREIVVLSLDGSHMVEANLQTLQTEQSATKSSILEHYAWQPHNSIFNDMTLLHFAKNYFMPKQLSNKPNRRRKEVIVVVHPYCIPDSD